MIGRSALGTSAARLRPYLGENGVRGKRWAGGGISEVGGDQEVET